MRSFDFRQKQTPQPLVSKGVAGIMALHTTVSKDISRYIDIKGVNHLPYFFISSVRFRESLLIFLIPTKTQSPVTIGLEGKTVSVF